MVAQRYKECMEELLKELEREFMAIIANPKLDKKRKNLLTKPLVTQKQILLNTLESLEMVERRAHEEQTS